MAKILDYKDAGGEFPQNRFQPTPDQTSVTNVEVPGAGKSAPFSAANFGEEINSKAAWVAPSSEQERNFFARWGHRARARNAITGEMMIAKRPATAHVSDGDWDQQVEYPNAVNFRYVEGVNRDGNVICWTISNAAGAAHPEDRYREHQLKVMRYESFVPVGECTLRLLKSKWFLPRQLVADVFRDPKAKVCSAGSHADRLCPHALAEREARLKISAKAYAEVQAQYAGDDPTTKAALAVMAVLDAREARKGK